MATAAPPGPAPPPPPVGQRELTLEEGLLALELGHPPLLHKQEACQFLVVSLHGSRIAMGQPFDPRPYTVALSLYPNMLPSLRGAERRMGLRRTGEGIITVNKPALVATTLSQFQCFGEYYRNVARIWTQRHPIFACDFRIPIGARLGEPPSNRNIFNEFNPVKAAKIQAQKALAEPEPEPEPVPEPDYEPASVIVPGASPVRRTRPAHREPAVDPVALTGPAPPLADAPAPAPAPAPIERIKSPKDKRMAPGGADPGAAKLPPPMTPAQRAQLPERTLAHKPRTHVRTSQTITKPDRIMRIPLEILNWPWNTLPGLLSASVFYRGPRTRTDLLMDLSEHRASLVKTDGAPVGSSVSVHSLLTAALKHPWCNIVENPPGSDHFSFCRSNDKCSVCASDAPFLPDLGFLIVCDLCPAAYHQMCVRPSVPHVDSRLPWACPRHQITDFVTPVKEAPVPVLPYAYEDPDAPEPKPFVSGDAPSIRPRTKAPPGKLSHIGHIGAEPTIPTACKTLSKRMVALTSLVADGALSEREGRIVGMLLTSNARQSIMVALAEYRNSKESGRSMLDLLIGRADASTYAPPAPIPLDPHPDPKPASPTEPDRAPEQPSQPPKPASPAALRDGAPAPATPPADPMDTSPGVSAPRPVNPADDLAVPAPKRLKTDAPHAPAPANGAP